MRTDNTTGVTRFLRVLILTSHSSINLYACTRMDKTIHSSMKIQINWLIILQNVFSIIQVC